MGDICNFFQLSDESIGVTFIIFFKNIAFVYKKCVHLIKSINCNTMTLLDALQAILKEEGPKGLRIDFIAERLKMYPDAITSLDTDDKIREKASYVLNRECQKKGSSISKVKRGTYKYVKRREAGVLPPLNHQHRRQSHPMNQNKAIRRNGRIFLMVAVESIPYWENCCSMATTPM